MPLKNNIRYRFKQVSPNERIRLAFSDNKVVEVSGYRKQNGRYVEEYTKRIKTKR